MDDEISFGSGSGNGRCRPDIVATRDGVLRVIEVKTGNALPTRQQKRIFNQIEAGTAIPRGRNVAKSGLERNVPLNRQGHLNDIRFEVITDTDQ